jgi:hypothetical protein
MENAIEGDEDLLWADGLLYAVIGIATRADGLRVVCYSIEKIIEVFMTRDGMTEEEAYEFYEFNVACAWVGDKTPIFVETIKGD